MALSNYDYQLMFLSHTKNCAHPIMKTNFTYCLKGMKIYIVQIPVTSPSLSSNYAYLLLNIST